MLKSYAAHIQVRKSIKHGDCNASFGMESRTTLITIVIYFILAPSQWCRLIQRLVIRKQGTSILLLRHTHVYVYRTRDERIFQ